MKISVLIPTRGRDNALTTTIRSLLDNFSQDNEIEILVRFDEDDTNTFQTVKNRIDDKRIKYFIGPKYGYAGLHRYINGLALEAKGDWLMLMTDDAIMQTKYWDKEIEKYNGKMVFLDSHNNYPNNDIGWFPFFFPIMPRKIFEIWEHISLSRHCDAWINCIANILEIKVVTPIYIIHDSPETTGNNRDETYANRKYQDIGIDPEQDALVEYDTLLLKRYISYNIGK